MQERIVVGVLRVVAKRESSFVGLRVRESGARVIRLGLVRRAAVHGIRRKGAVVSDGAMVESCCSFPSLFLTLSKGPMASAILQGSGGGVETKRHVPMVRFVENGVG